MPDGNPGTNRHIQRMFYSQLMNLQKTVVKMECLFTKTVYFIPEYQGIFPVVLYFKLFNVFTGCGLFQSNYCRALIFQVLQCFCNIFNENPVHGFGRAQSCFVNFAVRRYRSNATKNNPVYNKSV